MTLLKAVDKDGQTQYFNLNLILNMTPSNDGKRIKILMGGGLFWWVDTATIEILNYSFKQTIAELKGEPL